MNLQAANDGGYPGVDRTANWRRIDPRGRLLQDRGQWNQWRDLCDLFLRASMCTPEGALL